MSSQITYKNCKLSRADLFREAIIRSASAHSQLDSDLRTGNGGQRRTNSPEKTTNPREFLGQPVQMSVGSLFKVLLTIILKGTERGISGWQKDLTNEHDK